MYCKCMICNTKQNIEGGTLPNFLCLVVYELALSNVIVLRYICLRKRVYKVIRFMR